MASGQDKGKILKLLLASATNACKGDYAIKGRYKAIVFVDDDSRNIENVREAFASTDMKDRVVTVRYGWLDGDVEAFGKSDERKSKADRSWQALQGVICNEAHKFCPAVPTDPSK